jgi:putative FmdB family regulatory protein
MPLYEYQCLQCQEKLEAIQKFSDELHTICPRCGGELKKLISAPAFQFKGSGFHVTDYPRTGKAEGKEGTKEGGEKKEAERKEGTKESGEKKGAERKEGSEKPSTPSSTSGSGSSSEG